MGRDRREGVQERRPWMAAARAMALSAMAVWQCVAGRCEASASDMDGAQPSALQSEMSRQEAAAEERRRQGLYDPHGDAMRMAAGKAADEAKAALADSMVQGVARIGTWRSEFSGVLVSDRAILTTSHGACPKGQESVGTTFTARVPGHGSGTARVAACGRGKPGRETEALGEAAKDWAVAVLDEPIEGAKPMGIAGGMQGETCAWAGWDMDSDSMSVKAGAIGAVDLPLEGAGDGMGEGPRRRLLMAPFPVKRGYSGGPVACETAEGWAVAGLIAGWSGRLSFAAGLSDEMSEALRSVGIPGVRPERLAEAGADGMGRP